MNTPRSQDPHGDARVLHAGVPLAEAKAALIALHGRGSAAEDALSLAQRMAPSGTAILAPQAHGNTWYPLSFLASWDENEPSITSALGCIERLIESIHAHGIDSRQTFISGFSQGACLACEFMARNPMVVGAGVVLTGGLIGQDIRHEQHPERFDNTEVLLTTGDPDPHVPLTRVRETHAALIAQGANVSLHVHKGRPHTVNADELRAAVTLLARASQPDRPNDNP